MPGHDGFAKDRQQEESGAALVELVKLRASPINRCTFSVDSHFRDAQAKGERTERLGDTQTKTIRFFGSTNWRNQSGC